MSEKKHPRILIFIVAYNHEHFIEGVLARIPDSLAAHDTEILIIDDASQDRTFEAATRYKQEHDLPFKITVLVNPKNQRYGGNQKIGFHYAIENGFDILALVHGDGQYAPEALPELLEPLIRGEADLVMGSRMATTFGALKGGMPLYKYVGNKVLTAYQNFMLGTHLYEFHTGYRLYAVEALKKVPFDLVTNEFHFDNEMFLQIHFSGQRAIEIGIDTHYGDETCNVDGFRYAWDIFKMTTVAALQNTTLFYRRKFDLDPATRATGSHYVSKLGFASSHTYSVDAIANGTRVLNVGNSGVFAARALKEKGCRVDGIDFADEPDDTPFDSYVRATQQGPFLPETLDGHDTVLLLESLERFNDPEAFMAELSEKVRVHPESQVLAVAANVVFLTNRILVMMGSFNYSKRGILDLTHRRFFTFHTLRNLFEGYGFEIEEMTGIPAPFPLLFGDNAFSRFLVGVNRALIKVSKGLFSYQIMLKAKPRPSLSWLLARTREATQAREKSGRPEA